MIFLLIIVVLIAYMAWALKGEYHDGGRPGSKMNPFNDKERNEWINTQFKDKEQ